MAEDADDTKGGSCGSCSSVRNIRFSFLLTTDFFDGAASLANGRRRAPTVDRSSRRVRTNHQGGARERADGGTDGRPDLFGSSCGCGRGGDGEGGGPKKYGALAQAAEKVAKAEPLNLLKKGDVKIWGEPRILQEDDEYWREWGGTAFDSASQVDPEHGVSPVKLIDMRFIIALGEPSSQDLPKEAFIDLDTLKRLEGPGIALISISHPWQQPDHPDPKEVLQMRHEACSSLSSSGTGSARLPSSSSERGRGGRSNLHSSLSLRSSSRPL